MKYSIQDWRSNFVLFQGTAASRWLDERDSGRACNSHSYLTVLKRIKMAEEQTKMYRLFLYNA